MAAVLRGQAWLRGLAAALSRPSAASAASWKRATVCPPPLRSSRQLRGRVAVDVLVDPAVVRAEIAAPEADRSLLRLDRVQCPALVDVSRGGVLVLRRLPRISALHRVSPVRPDRVGEA